VDESTARDRLRRMVAADTDPRLDAEAINDLMTVAARPDRAGNDPRCRVSVTARAASTRYAAGDVVRQASDVERWWICQVPGTTGSTAPGWPVLTGVPRGTAQVVDGTVVWIDAGSRWSPTWDLAAAAADGWEQKAAQVAHRFTFTADGQRFDRSQIHAMCLDMADRFRRRGGVGSTHTGF